MQSKTLGRGSSGVCCLTLSKFLSGSELCLYIRGFCVCLPPPSPNTQGQPCWDHFMHCVQLFKAGGGLPLRNQGFGLLSSQGDGAQDHAACRMARLIFFHSFASAVTATTTPAQMLSLVLYLL